MPQYTASYTTSSGVLFVTVIDTTKNIVTDTATAPNGVTATVTRPLGTSTTDITTDIYQQLANNGYTKDSYPQDLNAVNAIQRNVDTQAKTAEAVSLATGNPPPQEKQAIPQPAASDPALPEPRLEPPPPPLLIQTSSQLRDVPLTETNLPPLTPEELLARAPDTGIEISAAQTSSVAPIKITANPIVQNDYGEDLVLGGPAPEVIEPQKTGVAYPNEFEGVDEAIALQKTIDTNTSGLPVLAEDGVGVASGVLTNPETGQTYYPVPTGSSVGLEGAKTNTQAQKTAQDQSAFANKQDWRVRLSLAPGADYLYKAQPPQGILAPLAYTNGVIFPYTPSISVQYNAHYDNYDLVHSNYKIFQYKNSSVDSITISCDFTAQDNNEANYLLAVIHFFRSVTKMFYGQATDPKTGTPPPLCYLSGLGSFQFDNHPLVINSFNYTLPTDVDYIRATSTTTLAGVNKAPAQNPNNTRNATTTRLNSSGGKVAPGAVTPPPIFGQLMEPPNQTPDASTRNPTYVPTKMTIAISGYPIVTRNDISNRFSLQDYANGKLLQGSKNVGGGIW
jgi:hypothetical protein